MPRFSRHLQPAVAATGIVALLGCSPEPYPATYTRAEGGGAVTLRLDEGNRAALVLRPPGGAGPQTAEGSFTVVGDSLFVEVRNFGTVLNARGRFEGGNLTLALPGARPTEFIRD